jgi:O-antigen/teichoic acid export membrane protein
MVASFASKAALGAIEAARLLLAPALTVANGSGWFFLGDFAKAQKSGTPLRARHAVEASLTLGGVTLVIALAALALAGPLGPVLTGGRFPVDGVALGGWALYTAVFAATLPLSSLATARKESRLVFVIRAVEMSLGLLILAALLATDAGWAPATPYCLSGGGVISAVVLWVMLRRADPIPRSPGGRRDGSSAHHAAGSGQQETTTPDPNAPVSPHNRIWGWGDAMDHQSHGARGRHDEPKAR